MAPNSDAQNNKDPEVVWKNPKYPITIWPVRYGVLVLSTGINGEIQRDRKSVLKTPNSTDQLNNVLDSLMVMERLLL